MSLQTQVPSRQPTGKRIGGQAYPISFPVDPKNSVQHTIGRTVRRDAEIVKVTAEDGLVGFGESHHGRLPGAVAQLPPLGQRILGKDATHIINVWPAIYAKHLTSHGMGAGSCIAQKLLTNAGVKPVGGTPEQFGVLATLKSINGRQLSKSRISRWVERIARRLPVQRHLRDWSTGNPSRRLAGKLNEPSGKEAPCD